MDEINWLNIIKWILIVLLAGFIGQFGKTYAKHLMEKTRAMKGKSAERKHEAVISSGESKEERLPPPQGRDVSSGQTKAMAKQEKKVAKALVKQKKKEVKVPEK